MLNDKIKIKNIHFKKKNNKTRVNLANLQNSRPGS